jgi:hypothetical protein
MDTVTTRTPERPRELFRTKLGHVYIVRYQKGQEPAVADVLARWAADPEIDFTWSDASDLGEGLDADPLALAKGVGSGIGIGVAFWIGVALAIWGWR